MAAKENNKIVKKYFNKYFKQDYIENDYLEFKSLVRILNKKDKATQQLQTELKEARERIIHLEDGTVEKNALLEKLLSENDINKAWGNASFGGDISKRDVIQNALMKFATGYGTGYTIEQICRELKLITKQCNLTTLGKRYLYDSYYHKTSV